ncbi:hypothetical protein EK904_001767 [Melospiza melodia maxima]|nr:hypothetical protein EK904_001767 [Melospiza melodia maxima]
MVGRSWAWPEGATSSVLSLVKDRDDKEAPDSDAEGYVEGLDDEEEDEDGTWDVLHGIPASQRNEGRRWQGLENPIPPSGNGGVGSGRV